MNTRRLDIELEDGIFPFDSLADVGKSSVVEHSSHRIANLPKHQARFATLGVNAFRAGRIGAFTGA